jgi:hypothetical protein
VRLASSAKDNLFQRRQVGQHGYWHPAQRLLDGIDKLVGKDPTKLLVHHGGSGQQTYRHYSQEHLDAIAGYGRKSSADTAKKDLEMHPTTFYKAISVPCFKKEIKAGVNDFSALSS